MQYRVGTDCTPLWNTEKILYRNRYKMLEYYFGNIHNFHMKSCKKKTGLKKSLTKYFSTYFNTKIKTYVKNLCAVIKF